MGLEGMRQVFTPYATGGYPDWSWSPWAFTSPAWMLTTTTWVPTGGGGFAKQYPPGMVGIPYAWQPGIGWIV